MVDDHTVMVTGDDFAPIPSAIPYVRVGPSGGSWRRGAGNTCGLTQGEFGDGFPGMELSRLMGINPAARHRATGDSGAPHRATYLSPGLRAEKPIASDQGYRRTGNGSQGHRPMPTAYLRRLWDLITERYRQAAVGL